MSAGLLELGEVMMTASERRLDIASRNIANASTPGYKASTSFATTLEHIEESADMAQGGLHAAQSPFDLALSSPGFFALRDGDQVYYTRNGQFTRAADGRLVNAQGMALQTDTLADVVIDSDGAEITADGAIVEHGAPVAHIGVFEPQAGANLHALGGSFFSANAETMPPASTPLLRPGMLEASNVDTATEMIAMMAAMREAEAGARVVQTYDGLIEQSIATFNKAPNP
ncbi:MAG: flagellar hook basal-body protein [Terricaulis sp.]